MKLNEESAFLYGNSFYRTLNSIDDQFVFEDISGKDLINQFLKGNELLRKYEYPEIELNKNK